MKRFIFLSIFFIISCASNDKIINENRKVDIINIVKSKYCINYNDIKNYNIYITRTSIYGNITAHSYFDQFTLEEFKSKLEKKDKLFLSYLSIFITIKQIDDKIIILNGEDKFSLNKADFYKTLWKVTIKKEIKREHNFYGDEEIIYRIDNFYIDDTKNLIYQTGKYDSKVLKNLNFETRINTFMKYNRLLKINVELTKKNIKLLVIKILKELNLYPKENPHITNFFSKNSNKFWKITIDNKVIIIIDDNKKKIVKIKKKKSFFIDLSDIEYPEYDSQNNCKSFADK